MYTIVKYTKKVDLGQYDYVFKTFDEFYKVVKYLYVPLVGVYQVAVITVDTASVIDFIENEADYSHLSVNILMEEQAMQAVENVKPESHFEEGINYYEVFKQMITQRGLLFDRYMIYKLYRSIDHDTITMMSVLDKLLEVYGTNTVLTEDKISEYYPLNDVIYPGQVLDRFLELYKYRWGLLERCQKQISNDVLVGAIVKELKKRVEAKAEYFKSGQTNKRTKEMNTRNLLIAYRVFVSERSGINDAFMLFKFYESGVSALQIKGGKNVNI